MSPASPSKIAPVYVVFGAETFLKREAVQEIAAQVLAGADPALALSEYDGSGSIELARVLDDLRTLPFLAPHRLVFIREADTFITRYRAELEDYCEQPSDTGVLLLECKSFPATTRLSKRVQSIGQAVKCESLSARAVPGWLAERCRTAYGKRIDAAASAMLAEYIGEDLGLLDSELNKLALYIGERPAIAAADIQALVGHTREEQVWGILSAIAAGSEGKALSLWEQVWETDRAAPGRAIAGMAYKVRQLLTAKRAQEGGTPLKDLARMLMIWGDDQRVRAELAAFSTEQIEGMLCQLLEADVAVKTGLAGAQSAIEAFIVKSCRARQQRRAI